MKHFWLVLLLGIGCALAVPQVTYADASAIELLLSKARSLEARGRIDLAEQTWQQILKADPNQPDALAGLAKAAKQKGKNDEAKAYLDRLRAINPRHPAIAQVENILAGNQQRERLQDAARLVQSKQYDAAMAIYRQVFGDEPPPGDWAIAYFETEAATNGGWEKATASLREFVRRYPDAPEYRLSLGRLLTYRPATRKDGMQMLETVKETETMARQAQAAWRQALVWENGSAASAPSLRAYLARYPDAQLQEMLAHAQKAAAAPAPAVAQPPAFGKELDAAYKALKANRLTDAETGFQEILKKNPKQPGALAGLGFVQMKNNDFASALQNFQAARELTPNNKDVNEALETARFWLTMQQATKAIKEQRASDAEVMFQRALTIRPSSTEALEGYAGALMQQGDIAGATPVLERLVKAEPQNTNAWRTLINAKYQKSGGQAALATIKDLPPAVSTELSKSVEYLALLASVYRDAGDRPASRKAFQEAVAMLRTDRTQLSEGVQMQLASLYLDHGDPMEGAAVYQRLVDVHPENIDAWEGLMTAYNRAKQYQRGLRALEQLPAESREAAINRPGFLRAVASLHAGANNFGTAEALLQRSLQIESKGSAEPSFYTQLQLAQVTLEQGQQDRAAQMFARLTSSYPDNPEGWKGLILTYHRQNRDDEAQSASRRIPADTLLRLQDDSDYLSLMAAIYRATGQEQQALQMVRQAIARFQAAGERVPGDLSVQLGWLLLNNSGNERELLALLRDSRARTDLTADQKQTFQDIEANWALRSSDDAMKSGDSDRATAILEAAARVFPADLRIRRSLAGILLQAGNSRAAFTLYKRTGLRDATDADYVAAVGSALTEHDTPTAELWLAEGLKKFPTNVDLLNMAARQAAAKGEFKKAEALWRAALQSAQEDERRQAMASREPARPTVQTPPGDAEEDLGSLLLNTTPAPRRPQPTTPAPDLSLPLEKDAWPLPKKPEKAPQVIRAIPLTDARQESEAAGWNNLLDRLAASSTPVSTASRSVQPESGDWISTMLAADLPAQAPKARPRPADAKKTPADEFSALEDRLSQLYVSEAAAAQAPIVSAAYTPASRSSASREILPAPPTPVFVAQQEPQPDILDLLTGRQNPANPAPAPERPARPAERPSSPALPALPVLPDQTSKREQIENQIALVEGRNSPFLGLSEQYQSRTGQPGFERMMLQENDMEASTILKDQVRVQLRARAIFATTPAPTSDATYRFGLLPLGNTFTPPSVSGLGVDAQLSTANFGMHVGSTPQSFPVHNILGGVRVRPAGGPITLMFDRDIVPDTILSIAGARDPVSNIVWGGVVSNAASINGNWGDERSGAYFNSGFQYITGNNVPSNKRIDGTVGAYWRVLAVPAGSLTAGANLFAMHYDKNLRFFTLGQGGYFSPQRFILFGVPITWRGSYRNFQYSAATTIGSQSFSEQSSAYFPNSSAIQGPGGPFYPNYSSSGTNYSVDFRAAYQISPNWFVGAYANVNNARFYTLQTVAVTVRYSLKGRSMDTDFTVPSIPDWRGRQPFGLP